MIPCYFDMRLEDEPLSLVFEVPRQLVEFYQSLEDKVFFNFFTNRGTIHKFFRQFKQPDEANPQRGLFDEYFRMEDLRRARALFDNYFGCGQTLVVEDKSGELRRLRALIPEGVIFVDQICPDCRGSKIDQKHLDTFGVEIHCHSCAGSGQKAIRHHELADELADNVFLLFDMVNIMAYSYKQPINSQRPMLMYLDIFNGGYGKQCIYGYYTSELRNYLQAVLDKNDQEQLASEVSQRMMRTYNLMNYGRNKANHETIHDFSADIEFRANLGEKQVWFYLQVPGVNGCSVYTDSMPSIYPPHTEEHIFSLTCHNIDRAEQQLALIAGLAHLCSSARRWLEQKL